MADNKISSKYEAMDQAYRDFSKEIGDFSYSVYNSAERILSTVNSIGDQWKGNGYDAFKENIKGKIDNIMTSLEKCDSIKDVLNDASEAIQKILEQLRESE